MAHETLQTWQVTEPFVNLHCGLAEGPYYEKATNTLRWVDIINKRVHTVDLDKGADSVTTIQLDVPVTVTADVEGYDPKEKILVGLKLGLALLDRKSGKYEYLTKFAESGTNDNARLRSNDGNVDPHGRFWLGSMTDFNLGPFQAEGGLFRFDGGKSRDIIREGLTIPNSITWSPDNKIMYYTHSNLRIIYALDYSLEDGSVSNERVFYKHEGSGEPDGHRIDVDGNLWTTIYGESRVLKISPQGKLVGEIKLPTRNITCCEFVGTELLITSAGDDEGDEKSKEYGGSVFRVDVGTTGLKANLFKLTV